MTWPEQGNPRLFQLRSFLPFFFLPFFLQVWVMTPFFVTSCEMIPFYDVAKVKKKRLVTQEEITLTHSLPSILINFFILKNLGFFSYSV